MPGFDLADVQGNVLRGYRFPLARYLFIRITDPAGGRRWLRSIVEHVTDSEPWDEKPGWALNIAFTHSGLQALGLSTDSLDTFPLEFRQGMSARGPLLGDTGGSSPDRWEAHYQKGATHAIAVINATSAPLLEARCAWLQDTLATNRQVVVIGSQDAARQDGGREHFGYVDGLSQPPVASGGRHSVKAGELLLGHRDETGWLPDAPQPDVLARNGTYLVFRKLYQDVALFRRFLAERSPGYPGGEERLAASLMGRWRDGTPTVLSPDAPDPALSADPHRVNAFGFAGDPDGIRCAIGAHIRRANPRDALDFGDRLVHRHRLVRRGLAYGDPLPTGAGDDGADRGLIFIALGACILRQFEFVQTQWMNDGNIFGLGADKDAVVGDNDGTGKMTVQGRPPWFLASLPRLVTTRGGEYFFLPGIQALHHLARRVGE